MKRRTVRALLAITGCAAMLAGFGASAQGGPAFGVNLVTNGDAEAEPGATGSTETVKPSGWTTTGNFTASVYGKNGPPNPTDPGPDDRGDNYFAGGDDSAKSTAEQTIDLGPAASAIDAGTVKYRLAGWLGGYGNQTDYMVVFAVFEDATGRSLGQAKIGPVTPSQRGNKSGLFSRETAGVLPAKTRAVVVRMVATRLDGRYNDAYADNIWFSIQP